MEESKIDFDVSKLTLTELVDTYENINSFLKFSNESKTESEKEEVDNDE